MNKNVKLLFICYASLALPYTTSWCMEQDFVVPAALTELPIPTTPRTAAAALALCELAVAPEPAKKRQRTAEPLTPDAPTAPQVIQPRYRCIGDTYTCAECKAHIKGYKAFLDHKRTHKGPLPFACTEPNCAYAAQDRRGLDHHMRTHTGEKPFKCDQCGKAFTQKANLNKHIESVHSTEKKFTCEQCGHQASRSDALTQHKRTHTGEKLYKCPYESCSFAAHETGHLNYHIRIKHTGERPYKCTYHGCDYAAFQTSPLRDHIRIKHTRERPYKCDQCDNTYCSYGQLCWHKKTKHPQEVS